MTVTNRFVADVEVRFRDLDAMGHVNHAVYLTYFEQGRVQLFGARRPEGFDFILARLECDYLRPVTLADRLSVHIQVEKIGTKSFTFSYRLVDRFDAETVYATATSVQVCFDYRMNASVPVPPELQAKLFSYLNGTD